MTDINLPNCLINWCVVDLEDLIQSVSNFSLYGEKSNAQSNTLYPYLSDKSNRITSIFSAKREFSRTHD
ncbi:MULTISPECIES: hypothetical protein [unclassified Tolypothrix]|uniref:hypothetical protein n=1 Tax=unclassified Tolypothrix TaxID=2649714 RepID=UPI0005EAA535|nr:MULTISPECIES: hypothetical protein [unclassified Tolypothrix]EKE97503.1 hypothetical protein FDUTEX481_04879 [Tolypothrix sp. PCC 7601]UYD35284.1 hypothetical protein HG267_05690 [Tolypothrix sp. PCC 7601]